MRRKVVTRTWSAVLLGCAVAGTGLAIGPQVAVADEHREEPRGDAAAGAKELFARAAYEEASFRIEPAIKLYSEVLERFKDAPAEVGEHGALAAARLAVILRHLDQHGKAEDTIAWVRGMLEEHEVEISPEARAGLDYASRGGAGRRHRAHDPARLDEALERHVRELERTHQRVEHHLREMADVLREHGLEGPELEEHIGEAKRAAYEQLGRAKKRLAEAKERLDGDARPPEVMEALEHARRLMGHLHERIERHGEELHERREREHLRHARRRMERELHEARRKLEELELGPEEIERRLNRLRARMARDLEEEWDHDDDDDAYGDEEEHAEEIFEKLAWMEERFSERLERMFDELEERLEEMNEELEERLEAMDERLEELEERLEEEAR
jgi:hypothetical protein